MEAHSFKKYDDELESIRGKILEMGGLVEEQLMNAVDSLVNNDVKLAEKILDKDDKINDYEIELDEEILLIIAKRAPTAGDLRTVLMMQKMVSDIERIGDEATKIARSTIRMNESDLVGKPNLSEIKTLEKLAQKQLQLSLDAFARLDDGVCLEIIKQDKEIDESYQATTRHQLTFMMEDPRKISIALETMFVAKAIERIGDHAVNIAEYVIYIVKGKDVRHASVREIKKQLNA
jgi:phosphate transport system protein